MSEIGGLEPDLNPVRVNVSPNKLYFCLGDRGEVVCLRHRHELRLSVDYGGATADKVARFGTCKAPTKRKFVLT